MMKNDCIRIIYKEKISNDVEFNLTHEKILIIKIIFLTILIPTRFHNYNQIEFMLNVIFPNTTLFN